jgi:glycosyltransferase involved in cell wall biosynthesis
MHFSVVIVCKNEAAIIGKTLTALQNFAPDIVVYDNGSTDATIETLKQYPVNLVQGSWEGFGKTKNTANSYAKYDWILSLDADEIPDDLLKQSLQKLLPENEQQVFEIKFKNFFGTQWLRYGEWGRDKHIRLFNKKHVGWNEAPVHEQLVFPEDVIVQKLEGAVLHYTAENLKEYEAKLMKYAVLNGEKYFLQGKKTNFLKKYISAAFHFIQNYFFRMGFLDGVAGFKCAAMMERYTFKKYEALERMKRGSVRSHA